MKDIKLQVRVSEEVAKELDNKAKALGIDRSKLIRQILLDSVVQKPDVVQDVVQVPTFVVRNNVVQGLQEKINNIEQRQEGLPKGYEKPSDYIEELQEAKRLFAENYDFDVSSIGKQQMEWIKKNLRGIINGTIEFP